MGKAPQLRLAAALLLAAATAGCSGFSTSLSAWMPWPKKQDQGLSWAAPDMSKSYGNQIAAERGGSIAPRAEMPKPPEQEGRIARLTSAVTKPVKSIFKQPETAAAPAVAATYPSFDSKQGSAAIYVSLAQVQEKQGNLAAAAEAYERALQAESSNLEALLGYARMQDRQGDFARATQLYQVASRLHPKEAVVYNDLGLCLSRQGKQAEAQVALAEAVRLRPDRKLYRNNLAKLLVDLGQPAAALEQLSAAHPPAIAQYNLGFLLQQKNETAQARQHFARALELDPTLADARQWLAMIDGQQIAEAPQRPVADQGAYAPVSTYTPAPAVLPVYPTTQPRVSMDSDFYAPSRY
jgi:Flp pilus assembly protein TadD